jgi:hypothetical protein
MLFVGLVPAALGVLVGALLVMGLYTRRCCQWCDYCGRFYWWIGWQAFEWTSLSCESWAMRCSACQWLGQQLHRDDAPLPPH